MIGGCGGKSSRALFAYHHIGTTYFTCLMRVSCTTSAIFLPSFGHTVRNTDWPLCIHLPCEGGHIFFFKEFSEDSTSLYVFVATDLLNFGDSSPWSCWSIELNNFRNDDQLMEACSSCGGGTPSEAYKNNVAIKGTPILVRSAAVDTCFSRCSYEGSL